QGYRQTRGVRDRQGRRRASPGSARRCAQRAKLRQGLRGGRLAQLSRMESAVATRPRVTLFMPVLNEIEGMKVIVPQIRSEWCDQVLVVDGGSRDGTLEYARERGF